MRGSENGSRMIEKASTATGESQVQQVCSFAGLDIFKLFP